MRGELLIHGFDSQPVAIVKETPTKYRVTPINDTLRLPLRKSGVRIILRGGTALVPKTAVRVTP